MPLYFKLFLFFTLKSPFLALIDTFIIFISSLFLYYESKELNKISGKKSMFAVSLEHNIAFSKVYSDYIVDKTYHVFLLVSKYSIS